MKDSSYNLIKFCLINKLSISVAESCTGGFVCSSLVKIPNASNVFKFGIIAYTNKIKEKILNVPKYQLKKHGAVSENTAKYMVLGVNKINKNIDFSLAITGIAGPGSEFTKKNVGLVYHSFYYKKENKLEIIKKNYTGSRSQIIEKAGDFAIIQSLNILKLAM